MVVVMVMLMVLLLVDQLLFTVPSQVPQKSLQAEQHKWGSRIE
jgi:hypothetical protein